MTMKPIMLAGLMAFGLGITAPLAQPAPDDETAASATGAAPAPAFVQAAAAPAPDPTAPTGPQTYVVKRGDSLSRIARRFYGNSILWQPILAANADKVGKGGGLIFPGTSLTIPDLNDTAQEFPVATAEEGTPKLSMVTGNDYTPFTDKDLPQGGMFTELVRTAMTRAGYDPETEFLPWDYAMRATRKGTFKASFPWYDTPDRRAALWYSRPVYEVLIVVYYKSGAPLVFEGIDDLDGLNLCRPSGYFDDDIRAKVEAGQIVRTTPDTPADCFRMLVEGDVDVVSLSAMVGNGELAKVGLGDRVEVADTPLAIRPLHIVYPKFDPRSRGTMGKVDLALKAMDEDGTTAAIIEKHLRRYFDDLAEAAESTDLASTDG